MDDRKVSSDEPHQLLPEAPAGAAGTVREQLEVIYRTESRRMFATLVRLLGDFDLAEEALHDAFRVAPEQWPREGVPANPLAWLVSTGRSRNWGRSLAASRCGRSRRICRRCRRQVSSRRSPPPEPANRCRSGHRPID